jgi:2-keto-3-deoxy-L-rhamnonate aldolase RhmA
MVAKVVRNLVKEKFARDEVVASMVVRIVQTPAISVLAASAGFDSLYVDLEHSPLSLETTSTICTAALATGVTPFVRVPAATAVYIGRVLDGGALGVIVPHVENAEDAANAVRLCRYPPSGTRSEGGPMPHFGYNNPPIAEKHRILNDMTSVIVMIETTAALEHLESIAAVPGIDMLFVGCNDLSADLGVAGDYDNPLLRDALLRTMEAARKHGKQMGIGGLGSREDLIAAMVGRGARYVSAGTDLSFLAAETTRAARFVRGLDSSRSG